MLPQYFDKKLRKNFLLIYVFRKKKKKRKNTFGFSANMKKMRYAKNISKIALRSFPLVFLVFMVIVVIRLTPFPDLDAPEEPCDRPCHELEWPRICRLRFILESHTVPRRKCDNETETCFVTESQYEPNSQLLTVNRQIPGPVIHVCLHDILVVDVQNRIPERSVSIHWRGQTHANNPLADGVPMVTQCPIVGYTTFQYKFRASTSGTHAWHLHNDENSDDTNNVYGMLVVRESVRREMHGKLADFDESGHAIALRGVRNSRYSSVLINGKRSTVKTGSDQIPAIFGLRRNRRYRFRIAHSGGNVRCPINGSIGGHKLLVIALDGNSIEPIYTTQFTIVPGERLDFILLTDQQPGEYEMKFAFADECDARSTAYATIKYDDNKKTNFEKPIHQLEFQFMQKFSTLFEYDCGTTTMCLENVKSMSTIPEPVLNRDVDNVFYFLYGYRTIQFGNLNATVEVAQINNITNIYPSSPLASQISDVPIDLICNNNKIPDGCSKHPEDVCYCTHVVDVAVGSVVELVLVNLRTNTTRDHSFHLHGHKFYVLGRRNDTVFRNADDVRRMDAEGNLRRNFHKPVLKDTISIPRHGLAVLRFVADNAGYWLLREEGSQEMAVVFNVIGSRFEVPQSFPRCGNYIGPKYFLA